MEFEVHDLEGFIQHCKVAELVMSHMKVNPHTKHHIRTAVRQATLKVTKNPGTGKDKASLMSDSAFKQMEQGNKDGLVLEHAVPVSVINGLVLALKSVDHGKICNIVHEWTVLSVITKSEHDLLSKLGLSKKMPDDWDGADRFARYKKAGITCQQSRYKELKKLAKGAPSQKQSQIAK